MVGQLGTNAGFAPAVATAVIDGETGENRRLPSHDLALVEDAAAYD